MQGNITEISIKLEKINSEKLENDKIISKIDSEETKNEDKLVETEKEIHIPLETSEKLIEGKLKQNECSSYFLQQALVNPLSFSALINTELTNANFMH